MIVILYIFSIAISYFFVGFYAPIVGLVIGLLSHMIILLLQIHDLLKELISQKDSIK
ncbi:hypothetical protein B0I26_101418 [Anoxybacillus vitaminiphilus]|uniref:Uncharacterized protein n=1 Tax=Paranoxybacillus vitaminiphilus TaxID=581036 RepID=A0A327YTR5_9BACL|nr:hypothetical protein B0I26_101418 [Anoxybacillus vitaminiphilus]